MIFKQQLKINMKNLLNLWKKYINKLLFDIQNLIVLKKLIITKLIKMLM